MPEGHTIHHAARKQSKQFAGEILRVTSPQGRFRAGARKLDGKTLEMIEAHGKHLFYHWDGGQILHVHLGLYGRFRWQPLPPPPPQGAIRLRMVSNAKTLDLHGPTACELISQSQREKIATRLGPDPLRRDADPQQVSSRIRKSRAAVGKLLLDQSVIAGVGNVYRSELLYALQLHPERPGNSLSNDDVNALWETICRWMKIGVKYNRIITVDLQQSGKAPGRLSRSERLAI